MTAITEIDAATARSSILAGTACDDLRVQGDLDLSGIEQPFSLPVGLQVGGLVLRQSTGITELPQKLTCFDLDISETPIRQLPHDLKIRRKFAAQRCAGLIELPDGFAVGSLNLAGCSHLEALPDGLKCWFLNLDDCTGFHRWPRRAELGVRGLSLCRCERLLTLPDTLPRLATLDVSGARNLRQLPDGLRVALWLDLADTGLTGLPASLAGVALRWRGVRIDQRIAFHPETLKVEDALAEPNAERRRVMLERIGPKRLMAESNVQTRDEDQDPGGPRRLLRIKVKDSEDLVFLNVLCPSTQREYFLRVPPTTQSCHQAAAWIAGFDNPNDYRPLIET